ncbi:MAG TPA: glycosyltransferase family 39 protein [Rhizomicrobium sp.]
MNSATPISSNSPATATQSVWLSDARVQVLAIIAVATALKLAVSPLVGLGTNEAYAIASGRLMSLSYFDHPPLHFWLAHLCELIFGDNSAARIPFILLSAATSWMMFALTRRLFGDRAGVWATLTLNLSVFFNLVSGNWILPDGPLNFFLLATALVLVPTAQGRSLNNKNWLAAGLLAGLAALSKYHAFLFLAGYLVFLLADGDRRRMLLTPGPWLAGAVALAVISPVLIWNASQGWASLRFQGGRAMPHHLGVGLFLSLLSAQIAVLLPGALIPLIAGTREALSSRNSEEQFLLWLGLPIVVLFTFIPLVTDNGMMQWAMPGWLMLLPLAGRFLDERSRARLSIGPGMFFIAAVLFAATVAAGLEFQSGWLGTAFPHMFKRRDPTADNANWVPLAPIAQSDPKRTFALASSWREAAKIDEALGGKYRVIVASNDPRNFAIDLDPTTLDGKNGWIVLPRPLRAQSENTVRACFRQSTYAASLIVARNERPDASLIVFRGDGFRQSRCNLVAFKR